MLTEMKLYQYREHDLIQLTDGRSPWTDEEHKGGWRLRETLSASVEAVSQVSARAPSEVLGIVEKQGHCMLNKFEIEQRWRRAHTAEGGRYI